MTDLIDVGALWRVAVLSLAFGVGVVGLYALGVAAVTPPEGAARTGAGRRALAVSCFAVCGLIIVVGLRVMLDK